MTSRAIEQNRIQIEENMNQSEPVPVNCFHHFKTLRNWDSRVSGFNTTSMHSQVEMKEKCYWSANSFIVCLVKCRFQHFHCFSLCVFCVARILGFTSVNPTRLNFSLTRFLLPWNVILNTLKAFFFCFEKFIVQEDPFIVLFKVLFFCFKDKFRR